MWKKLYKISKRFLFRCSEDYITVHGAYSALFVFMSIFPLIMFILTLLTTLNISKEFFLQQLLNITPSVFHEFVTGIYENMSANSTTLVMSVSVIFALWSASAGVYGLVIGLNDCYRTYDTRSYVRRRGLSILYTIIFIIVVGFSLGLLVFGNVISNLLSERFPGIRGMLNWIQVLKYPVIFLVLFAFFLLLYYVFPFLKSKLRSHIPGAFISALGWLVLSYFFSLYVNNFPSDAMYGSLTMVVLYLLWLWLALCLIFIGGVLNCMIMDYKGKGPLSEYRESELLEIEEREAELRNRETLNSANRKPLRKVTTRQRHIDRMWEEKKEAGEKPRPKPCKENEENR